MWPRSHPLGHKFGEPPWTCWWGLVEMEYGGPYLLFSEVQGGGKQAPLRAHHILLPCKLLLQPGQLVTGEDGPDSLGFGSLGFEDGEAALGDQKAWRGEKEGRSGWRKALGRVPFRVGSLLGRSFLGEAEKIFPFGGVPLREADRVSLEGVPYLKRWERVLHLEDLSWER